MILLNGTSSSGKSTLATNFQKISTDPWLHVEIDSFLRTVRIELLDESTFFRLLTGIHSAVGALARAGNRVIFDTVLQEGSWLLEFSDFLDGVPVFFVGVHCSLEVLEQRERERDRGPGTASHQIGLVHRYGPYDLEIDTSVMGEHEAARCLADWLASEPLALALGRAASALRT